MNGTAIATGGAVIEGAGTGADGVVIGVLTFESLREGDFAVSSLFLEDDTGKENIAPCFSCAQVSCRFADRAPCASPCFGNLCQCYFVLQRLPNSNALCCVPNARVPLERS